MHRRRRFTRTLLAALPLAASLVSSASAADPAATAPTGINTNQAWQDAPFCLPVLRRDVASANTGRTHRIFVYVPATPPPPAGYPVLYLLDGNATHPLATLLLRSSEDRAAALGLTPGIVVGVGYPVDTAVDPVARTLDYTPPAPDLSDTGDASGHPQGGADRFLAFLEDELKPLIQADYPVDPARQTLFGHSYGGLFTLHTVFTRPGAFRRYVASSPSIWWNRRHILTEKDTWLAALPADLPRLAIAVGSLEQTPPADPHQARRAEILLARRQVDNARELAAELAATGILASFHLFEGENHGSARVPGVHLAIRVAFGE